MKTRNGLFADVPENLWNDWHWQVANRAETVEDLKKYMTLTPDEEAGIAKTLGKLRMAVTPYYLSLIDLDDPFDPIRKMAIPRAEELEYADYEDADPLHEDTDSPVPGLTHQHRGSADKQRSLNYGFFRSNQFGHPFHLCSHCSTEDIKFPLRTKT